MAITSKQRAQLRGMAMSIDTIIQIGKGGITESVVDSVSAALKARELVKGKVLENSMLTAREACDELCEKCRAEGVQVIGTKFVLYKRNEKEPKIVLVKDKKKMTTVIYGGSFNPPHLGHVSAAQSVYEALRPDRFLIIPTNIAPHKAAAAGSPDAAARLQMCRLAFAGIPGAEVSPMEMEREGKSYTADTISILREKYPEDELYLVVGTDMFLSFREWHEYKYLLDNCTLAVLSRETDDRGEILSFKRSLENEDGAHIRLIDHEPLPMSSAEIRAMLPKAGGAELLDDGVYSLIIKNRWYAAKPELRWLREKVRPYLTEKRARHVAGCEEQAVKLARRWGADVYEAAEAGILHDITKKLSDEEQLIMCDKYGIILDAAERRNPRILHARTGAALARELFGIPDGIYSAIRWHTTGKPDMSLMEKIIYLADFTEPTRDFEGVEPLRKLCFEDIDRAMELGLRMSLEEIRSRGEDAYKDTVDAYQWYKKEQGGSATC